jgi:hypothetical protein
MFVLLAIVGVFFISDLVYTLDHYFVHHDKKRYLTGHGRHHARYGGAKSGAQLDWYEVSTYATAALMSMMPTSLVSLFTGNPGFFLGAVLKFGHSLLFHLYQHGWWTDRPVSKLGLEKPTGGWGIASAAYHAHHHAYPNDAPFTYTETWKGFDRILEWAHPWLVRFTADGQSRVKLPVRSARTLEPHHPEQA